MQGINFAKKATCNRAIDANSGIPGETPDFRNVVYGFITFRRMIMLTTVKLCGMIKPQVRKPAGVHSIALTTRRITMSKTTKLPFRRLSILGATVALIVGATTAAADDVTATVFTAANVEYANLQSSGGPGLEYERIGRLDAGASATLICWSSGSSVPSPFEDQPASNIWYKVAGYPNAWVSDAYLYTGSDQPVVPQCEADEQPTTTATPATVSATVFSDPAGSYSARSGPATTFPEAATYQGGSTVNLGCWISGESVKDRNGKASATWYQVADVPGAWINDRAVNTGSDEPVTTSCFEGLPVEAQELYRQESSQLADVSARTASIYSPPIPNINFPILPNSRKRIFPFLVEFQLAQHYFDRTGQAVDIDFSFFTHSKHLRQKMYSVKIGSSDSYEATPGYDGMSMVLAVRKFEFKRTSNNCFVITDRYDFHYKTEYEPLKWANNAGVAKEFDIYSSGCFS